MYLRALLIGLFICSTAAGRSRVAVQKAPATDTVIIKLTDGSFGGAIARAFMDSARIIHKIDVTLSGDTGKVIDELYYAGGELIFAHRETHDYEVPSNIMVPVPKKPYVVFDWTTFDRRTMKPIPQEMADSDSGAISDSVGSIVVHDWYGFESGTMVYWKHDNAVQIDGESVELRTREIDSASVEFKMREKEIEDFAMAILARFRQ